MEHILAEQLKARSHYAVIDVREYPEYAAGAIPGARLVPLSTLESTCEGWDRSACYLLVCKSGKRSLQGAERLVRQGFRNVAVLEGGTEAWKQAGFPLESASRKPWALERQVRVIAGAMVAASTILGIAVSPWFFAWTLFVGFGLVFAGTTNLCLMATVLGKMPWNQPTAQNSKGAL